MTSSLRDTFELPDTAARQRRRLRDYIAVGIVGVLLVAAAAFGARALLTSCGGIGSGVTVIDGQCVGVTDGSYVFDKAYRAVQKKIEEENKWVEDTVNDPGQSPHRAVTVALLNPMTITDTSAYSVDEIRTLMEGAYTAQHRVNHSAVAGDPDPLIRLVLANEGGNQAQWEPVVDQLVGMKDGDAPLDAVVGLGVSIDLTKDAAKKLAEHDIPAVGAITTAEQLNYQDIEGFVRVSPSNRDYVASLRAYLDHEDRSQLDSAILVYDRNSESRRDIFIDSLRAEFTSQMDYLIKFPAKSFVGKVKTSGSDPTLFQNITDGICSVKPRVVLFAGRKVDLGSFLDSLENRGCQSDQMTVLTVDADPNVFGNDEEALRSKKITVVYADASNPRGWVDGVKGTPDGFPEFRRQFEAQGFGVGDLDDGGAISYHDAVLVAARAIRLADVSISGSNVPEAAEVVDQMLNLNTNSTVTGASGTLSFSYRGEGGKESGNPVGKPIPVLEFPSFGDSPAASGMEYITRE